ncbi:calcium-binding protein [Rhizobium sp.]
MATIKYFGGKTSDIRSTSSAGTVVQNDDKTAELLTGWGDDRAFVTGDGLASQDGKLVGGTATEIVYKTFEGDSYRITGISFSFSQEAQLTFMGDDGLFGGSDRFVGSRGDDFISGWGGKDFIRGGRGNDIIRGGEGDDVLRGGQGSDTFIFAVGDGTDRIRDFDTSGPVQDVIRISGIEDISDISITQRNKNVVISYGDDTIILRQTDIDDLSPRNFAQARHFDFDFG